MLLATVTSELSLRIILTFDKVAEVHLKVCREQKDSREGGFEPDIQVEGQISHHSAMLRSRYKQI